MTAERTATLRWTDDHCHLHHGRPSHVAHDEAASGAVDEVVAHAASVGVERMITVGCDVADSVAAADIAAAHPGRVWATAGVHPHEAIQGIDGLEAVLDRPEVVAVGECGLDYHYDHSPREQQREVFRAQIALAQARDLPLVIHTREAWEDTFAILEEVGAPRRTVFHCFTGDAPEARRGLDLGALLSISGIVTFKTADDIRRAVELAPLDRLMVETDSPFLTPVPHRGQPNIPGHLPLVGRAVAEVKGIGLDEVAAATWQTTADFYALSPA